MTWRLIIFIEDMMLIKLLLGLLNVYHFSPGRYLLEHNSKTGAFVRLVQSVEISEKCSKTFDLQTRYAAARPDEERPMTAPPPWLPIDVNIVTRNSIVPALFTPKQFVKNTGKQTGYKRNQN